MFKSNKEIIIEKLSCIAFERADPGYILRDELRDKVYNINDITYEICKLIDGEKTLTDIAMLISSEYHIDLSTVKQDVYDVYMFLRKNKIVIIKKTIIYYVIKIYYMLSLLKMEE